MIHEVRSFSNFNARYTIPSCAEKISPLLSCVPVIGSAMLIYNLSHNHKEFYQLLHKNQRFQAEFASLRDQIRNLNQEVRICHAARSLLRQCQNRIFRELNENRNGRSFDNPILYQTVINTRLRSEIAQYRQFSGEVEQYERNIAIKLRTVVEKKSAIEARFKSLEQAYQQNEQNCIQFWNFFLVSSSLSLTLLISGLALGIIGNVAAGILSSYAIAALISVVLIITPPSSQRQEGGGIRAI